MQSAWPGRTLFVHLRVGILFSVKLQPEPLLIQASFSAPGHIHEPGRTYPSWLGWRWPRGTHWTTVPGPLPMGSRVGVAHVLQPEPTLGLQEKASLGRVWEDPAWLLLNFLFFYFFWAVPSAYGSSWALNLHLSCSNTRSLTCCARLRIEAVPRQ